MYDMVGHESTSKRFKKDMKEEEERGWKSHKRTEILKGIRDNRET